jgi:hypothetical protein
MNIVHFKDIAEIGRAGPGLCFRRRYGAVRSAVPRTRDAREPVEKVKARALSLAFADRPR